MFAYTYDNMVFELIKSINYYHGYDVMVLEKVNKEKRFKDLNMIINYIRWYPNIIYKLKKQERSVMYRMISRVFEHYYFEQK